MLQIKSVSPNSEPDKGVLQYAPTEHGGNIYKIAEELGLHEDKLIDFSASINPLGISKTVKNVIKKELNCLVNYPDPDAAALRRKLSQRLDVTVETIICANGSTELIYLVPRALKPAKVLIPAPTFSEYERACKLDSELRVMSYELKKENNFEIIPDEFISAMKGGVKSKFKSQKSKVGTRALHTYPALNSSRPCDMAFLCNPNNPTGHLLKSSDVLRIAEAARDMKCVLVVDEAFIDFAPEESVIGHVQHNPYLIVLRSMTKFYALTGLRIGYGIFHPATISKIKAFKEPWTANSLAQKAAIAALEDGEYQRQTFKFMEREKDFFEKSLKRIGIEFFPSDVNYYLLKIPPCPPLSKGGWGDSDFNSIVMTLQKKGILVRGCSNFKGLDGSYIRVAVKSRKHNRLLVKELSVI